MIVPVSEVVECHSAASSRSTGAAASSCSTGAAGLPVEIRGGGGYEVGPPQKRKVLCRPMYFGHFSGPCLPCIIFATFNLRQELLLFRGTFLTPFSALRGADRKKPVSAV